MGSIPILLLSCLVLLPLLYGIPVNKAEYSVENKLDTGVSAVHSRLRSVLRNTKHGRKKRRRTGQRHLENKAQSLIADTDFFIPDTPENVHRIGHKVSQNMPKIYITKLPVTQIKEEPQIFFTKVLKDKHTSIEVFDIIDEEELSLNSSSGMFEDISLKINDKDNVISENSLEPAIRSNHVNQDGLENVNDMIDNSQTVNQPSNNINSFEGETQRIGYSTEYPYLEFVSSTAMIFSNHCEGDDACDVEYESKQTDYFEQDLTNLGSADNIKPSTPTNDGIFKDEKWVLPIVMIASATIVFLLSFEVFIYLKTKRSTPSCRHLFLGQMLLAGLLSCAVMALVFTMKPTTTICAVSRFGSGLSFTLVFSTLLVKLVFLISMNNGIYLPSTYQILLLVFAVLIQLAISIQWIVAVPPSLSTEFEPLTCATTFQQQLHGQIYNIFLIVVLTVLSLKFYRVRPTYREALYISMVMVLTVIIWTSWIIAGYILPANYADLCSSVGLLASTVATFSVMFLPRGRQLSATGKDGVYPEDRAEVYNRQETASPGGLSRDLSLFSVNTGSVQFCLPVRNLFQKTRGSSREDQNAVVKSIIQKTFGSQRNKPIHALSSSSGVDGSIYSSAEEQHEGHLEIEPRSQTMDNLARSVLTKSSGLSKNKQAQYQTTNSFDRFPFSSRPPQFNPNDTAVTNKATTTRNQQASASLYRVDSYASKIELKSKPSLSNPNVLFCTPKDMTNSIIY